MLPAMTDAPPKVKTMTAASPVKAYRDLAYGGMPLGKVLWAEFLYFFVGPLPGALGLALRKILYPSLFRSCGRGVIFGRNLLLRHPHKIDLADKVVLDDNVTLDAKGATNRGITLGERVYIGRGSSLYTKNGDIVLGDNVSVSANAILFSSNSLSVGKNTVIASFAYLLSGGEYDPKDPTPFAFQPGTCTKGPLSVGEDCWIGTGVKILDAAQSIGPRAVVAAGAVVTKPLAGGETYAGVPARPLVPKA